MSSHMTFLFLTRFSHLSFLWLWSSVFSLLPLFWEFTTNDNAERVVIVVDAIILQVVVIMHGEDNDKNGEDPVSHGPGD